MRKTIQKSQTNPFLSVWLNYSTKEGPALFTAGWRNEMQMMSLYGVTSIPGWTMHEQVWAGAVSDFRELLSSVAEK